MTLAKHLTEANFDLRSRKNTTLALEMHNLLHLDKTPTRGFVFS